MILARLIELAFGVEAARKSLEDVAVPLSVQAATKGLGLPASGRTAVYIAGAAGAILPAPARLPSLRTRSADGGTGSSRTPSGNDEPRGPKRAA
jgi:hypothetical protein